MKIVSIAVVVLVALVSGQKNTNQWHNRNTIVHLFEWKYKDIAAECENFLAPKGFGGVQTSPIHEHWVDEYGNRRWYERYQVYSYKIMTRSGNEQQLADMIRRCNAVGVRVYVDVIFNHMSGDDKPYIGTAGAIANPPVKQYPRVPWGPKDFHDTCLVRDYTNVQEVRNCELLGMHDLNQSSEHVRCIIVEVLDHLIDLGVAGFRIDAAKHMWPEDLEVILSRVKDLSTNHGFAPNSRPLIYQEVIDLGTEPISKYEYTHIGRVTEFKHCAEIGRVFKGLNQLKYLKNCKKIRLTHLKLENANSELVRCLGGPEWDLLHDDETFIFIDNHDNQRGHGGRGFDILTHKQAKNYKMATAFMLAHPYGSFGTRIMSSYAFTNTEQGPPQDLNGNIISPRFSAAGTCTNGWVCEHRWRQIYNMVAFRNAVKQTGLMNWWDNGSQQIAFSRGNKGFVAFNLAGDMRATLQTGLPEGEYCDVISGSVTGYGCTGKMVRVKEDGTAFIEILANEEDGVVAIYVGQSLKKTEYNIIRTNQFCSNNLTNNCAINSRRYVSKMY